MGYIVLAIASILFLFAVFLLRKLIKRHSWVCNNSYYNITSRLSSKPVPEGSFGIWPFLGETIDFISCAYSHSPERFVDKRRRLHGNVFKTHLFGSPTIISTDAEINKIVLQSDAKTFVPSYPKSLMELMGKSSILSINGSLHRRIHGLIASFFKSPALKAQITSDMQNYVMTSMKQWREDSVVYIQDEAKDIAFQVLVKALIGLESTGDEMKLLKINFQEFIAGLVSLPLNLPGMQLHRSLRAKKKMVKLIHGIIKLKRDREKLLVAKDVADILIQNDASEELTDDLIAENMIDLMIPGEDSVPVLMTLAIKYLSDSPIALKQLTEENLKLKTLKEKLKEPYSWTDYLSLLPFTQAVITETLRMGNIIVGVMRKAMKDVEIKGHLIPRDWCVFAYFRAVHLDDELHKYPHRFNPWRWLNMEMSNCKHLSPFGGGQRLCPGIDLARLEASIFIHHFVTQFRWEAESDSIINFPTVRMQRRMPVWVKKITFFYLR